MSNKSEQLESLRDIVNNAPNIGILDYASTDFHWIAKKVIDDLLYEYTTLDEVTELLEQTKKTYFSDIIQREDQDEEKIALLQSFDKIHYYPLTSIFNGTSHIPNDLEGKLKEDLRIYRVLRN